MYSLLARILTLLAFLLTAFLAIPLVLKVQNHCFLNCPRAKSVWLHFTPLLSALLSLPFVPNCASVFLYQFSCRQPKNLRLLLFVIKTILYGIWIFRNKATFHNGKENSRAIIRYINQDIKKRIFLDKQTLPHSLP